MNSSQFNLTSSSLALHTQVATFLSWQNVFSGHPPHPRPSREIRGQEAPVLHTGNDPDVLPLSAPPSTQIGYIFHALPSFHPGVLFSSLDINPCRVGAVEGRGACKGEEVF